MGLTDLLPHLYFQGWASTNCFEHVQCLIVSLTELSTAMSKGYAPWYYATQLWMAVVFLTQIITVISTSLPDIKEMLTMGDSFPLCTFYVQYSYTFYATHNKWPYQPSTNGFVIRANKLTLLVSVMHVHINGPLLVKDFMWNVCLYCMLTSSVSDFSP